MDTVTKILEFKKAHPDATFADWTRYRTSILLVKVLLGLAAAVVVILFVNVWMRWWQ